MKKIVIAIVAVLVVVMSVVGVYQELACFFNKSSIDNQKITSESQIKPIYLVKNIDVAENGNIFIGTKNGIFMFNKGGKCVSFLQLSMNYKFKVISDKLIVVRNYDRNKCFYDVNIIHDNNIEEKFDESHYKEIKMYYKDYCDKNGFKNSKTVKKDDAEYEYSFYGKVKVTKNGESKILNLEKKWFPLPFEYILILDGTLLFAFLVVTVVKVVKKKK